MVIDTNVAAVAQGLKPEATDACRESCIRTLLSAREDTIVSVDASSLIIQEYIKVLGLSGKPGVGRAFVKWLFDHQYIEERVERVNITANDTWRMFDEFPDDADLRAFDNDDRMFVAVAKASQRNPSIYNACDGDYADHAIALARHVRVVEVCK